MHVVCAKDVNPREWEDLAAALAGYAAIAAVVLIPRNGRRRFFQAAGIWANRRQVPSRT